MLPAGELDEVELAIASSSLVLLRMDEIIARKMLRWLKLSINRYCCI